MKTFIIFLSMLVVSAPAIAQMQSEITTEALVAQEKGMTEKKIIAARKGAVTQLERIDKGDYNYDEGYANIFRGVVTQEAWSRQISAVRSPLGKTLSRELLYSTYDIRMPGVPDGEYVTLQFDTSYEYKAEAKETIVMIFEDDEWKLGGYFIQ